MKDIVMNKITLSGIVAENYETTGKNANIAEFTIIAKQNAKHGNDWVEEPVAYPVKMFIRDNDDTLLGIKKDAKVIVLGTLKPFWKDSATFSGYSIWVDTVQFFEVFQTAPMAQASRPASPAQKAEPVGPEGFDESQIPF